MTELAINLRGRAAATPTVFAGAIFTSAMLVFLVQPMIAKMILPQLGGSPAVWNASMAFFQAALLLGYGYAHLLQRLPSIKAQVVVHIAVLAAAGATLPLHVTQMFGDPPVSAPVTWLLAVLAVSVGAPFAALSATAPLLQAWYAKVRSGPDAENPYVLYAASNLGSMLALLAYPVIFEPLVVVSSQTLLWTAGYAAFALLLCVVAVTGWRSEGAVRASVIRVEPAAPVTWRDRLTWTALAAAASSLMLGVTTHISTDVASAPFLWVLPLALYLLTFIIAFQAKPLLGPDRALRWQTVFLALCAVQIAVGMGAWSTNLLIHLGAFFFTALVCHMALVARRPQSARLTEFYLLMSLGGVIGGAFNAFVAPAAFESVIEYPLVIALACLARPWGGRPSARDYGFAVAGIALVGVSLAIRERSDLLVTIALLAAVGGAAAAVAKRAPLFAAVIGALAFSAHLSVESRTSIHNARSFFGVHRVQVKSVPALGGDVHLLVHGTTLHGAQPLAPSMRCTPTNYYAASGAIAQTYSGVKAARPALNIGVVGLGGGSVAMFARPQDRLRFFEIDPEVERIARDRRYFTYLSDCAQGPVDVKLGDARLTLAREPAGAYDLIHLDAFSSDSVPTHLLTAEAMQIYFRALKPDGVLLLHISNRNLALEGPAAAAGRMVGAESLMQNFRTPKGTDRLVATSSDVMILSKSPQSLERFRADPRWRVAKSGARPWTDDYTNVIGAVAEKLFKPG